MKRLKNTNETLEDISSFLFCFAVTDIRLKKKDKDYLLKTSKELEKIQRRLLNEK